MNTTLYLAPLQGYTESYFRNAFHLCFKDFDKALSPFIPSGLGNKVKHRRIYDLWTENNNGMPVSPQLLGNKAEEMIPLANYLYNYGYSELNINMGCPVTHIARKGRGSGILSEPKTVESLLHDLFHHTKNKISLKMRLGYQDTKDIKQLLPIINQFPIFQIIIHPRLGTQMYKGTTDIEGYQWCLQHTKIPIVYSGDIFSVQDFEQLQKSLPIQQEWMIGRGVLYNLFLAHEIKHRHTYSTEEKRRIFAHFHLTLHEELQKQNFSARRQLSKLKEYWAYFSHHFDKQTDIHYKLSRTTDLNSFLAKTQKIIENEGWKIKQTSFAT